MQKIVKRIESISKETLMKLFTLTVALIIFLDMDQWIYPYLDRFGLPLPSTILTFIWLPIYILLVFFVLETNKKKVLLIAVVLGVIYVAYFIVHHLLVNDLETFLRLQNYFHYSLIYELIYMFILLLPLVFVYVIYRLQPSFTQTEKIMVMVAMMISIPIVITNLLTISPSTYVGWTKSNFLTWFTGIYDVYHPRELATKFFFTEGNTTGIVLFATFPFTINLMRKFKASWKTSLMVIVQGLAMFCIATRVASYGVIIIMIAYLMILLVMYFIKKEKPNRKFIAVFLLVLFVFGLMFKQTPAYVNQQINADNNFEIIENEGLRQQIKGSIVNPNLDPLSEEFINYYSHIFVDNAFLLSIPPTYYMNIYYYRLDPKFWVDLIFEYDFYQRADGRDFEKIFSDYQWNKLSNTQKMFGFGYSTFMNGGILLEKDFEMQVYTHGYIGFTILVLPWIGALLIILYKGLRQFKNIISADILVCGVSFCGILISAYSSGHTLDEPFSSILLALLVAELLLLTKTKKEGNIDDKI